jgi:transcriptional regulator with XRE-family HTH domain
MVLREGLGRAVGRLRTVIGLSQEKLAAAAGLSSSAIYDIERGAANATADTIERVAKALGTTPLFLVRLATAEEQDASRTPIKEPKTRPGYAVTPDPPLPRRFPIVIEPAPGGHSAYCPDLPGCAAVAPTRPEVEAAMQTEISKRLAWLRSAGRPIPEPTADIVWIEVTA